MDIDREKQLKEIVNETLEPRVGVSIDDSEDQTDFYIVSETDDLLLLGNTTDRLINELGVDTYEVEIDYNVGENEYRISIYK